MKIKNKILTNMHKLQVKATKGVHIIIESRVHIIIPRATHKIERTTSFKIYVVKKWAKIPVCICSWVLNAIRKIRWQYRLFVKSEISQLAYYIYIQKTDVETFHSLQKVFFRSDIHVSIECHLRARKWSSPINEVHTS